MKCLFPRSVGVYTYGCNKCLPCRVNRRRVWTHRIMLEALCHSASSFVTLTYSDQNLPNDNSVDSREIQLFMKRLRKAYGAPLRYFAVGEYGEETYRPHYHLALFGLGSDGVCRLSNHGARYDTDPLVDRCWNLGKTDVKPLVVETAAYLCGYVVKKLTDEKDERLCGRSPEFARMSRKPGIGAPAIASLAAALFDGTQISSLDDVPTVLRHGNKTFPLGPYMRRLLRDALEPHMDRTRKEIDLETSEKLLALFVDYVEAQEEKEAVTVKSMYADVNKQRFLNEANRHKIYSKRKVSL